MKEKVLITGASGFVGYHLVVHALALGMEVYAAVRPSSDLAHLQNLGLKFVVFDFSDKEAMRRNFERDQYDYVIHAAGLTKARTMEEYSLANTDYTVKLAEAAMSFPVKKFLFLSSLAALGPISYDNALLIDEAAAPGPVTNYGRSKLNAEKGLIQMEALPLMIVRPTAVYGPRERDLLIMFKTLNRGLEPYIGKNSQWLSFIYVKDLVNLIFKAIKSPLSGQIYNVSDGQAYSRYDLADIVKTILRKKTFRFHVPLPAVKVIAEALEWISRGKAPVLNREKLNELTAENWNCSIEKARTELDFLPEFDLASGMEETIEWYKQNKWL